MADEGSSACTVRLMGFDVDGILTDGRLFFTDDGLEMKAFHVRDGLGMRWLLNAGIEVAIVTGRRSQLVENRCRDLGIRHLQQGTRDKVAALAAIAKSLGLDLGACGYMGDDVVDLPVLRACTFSATAADSDPRVLREVDFISRANGGHGAVREVCEHLLAAQGLLTDAVEGPAP